MSVLRINGLPVGPIVSAGEEPRGTRRDVGGEVIATDGTTVLTRSSRKKDLRFKTTFLSESDAHAWESLVIGEGEVWSFDVSLYGSKGSPPSAYTSATLTATTPKFGANKLTLAATVGTITLATPTVNIYGNTTSIVWTVLVWRTTDGGTTWTHYTVRGSGVTASAKWVDGVRNDGASTTWLTVASDGKVTIANTSGSAVSYDDLTILPYAVLDSWPPVLGTGTRPWAQLPTLEVSGTWVQEQPYRRVLGAAEDSRTKVAGGVRTVRLDVDLRAR